MPDLPAIADECLSTSQMPEAIKRLELTPGDQTVRMLHQCPGCTSAEDEQHHSNAMSCVVDVWVTYDPVTQEDTLGEQISNRWVCDICGDVAGSRSEAIINNKDAITQCIDDLLYRTSRLNSINAKPGQIPCCDMCGSSDIKWDGYARIDPHTNSLAEPQTFDKGCECEQCNNARVRPNYIEPSAHEAIPILSQRKQLADETTATLERILLWLRHDGHTYGVAAVDIDALVEKRDKKFAVDDILAKAK